MSMDPKRLAAINEALEQFGRGEPITAQCPICERVLVAIEVAVTGTLVIACPDQHTYARFRRAPPG